MSGGAHRVGDTQQVVEQQQILRIGVGNLRPNPLPRGVIVEVADPYDRPQQPRHHMKRDVAGVGFTEGR